MEKLNIAVVGSGISGLSAAWLLSKRHRVTVFEAGNHVGGHANTIDVETPDGTIAVDAGFIVYNEPSYPNLSSLFRHLDVASYSSDMSFAFSSNSGEYEYNGCGAGGFFGQKRNLIKPQHWRMLVEISRFFRTGAENVRHYPATTSLGDFLKREGYSEAFVIDHIIPMGAAIWSTSMAEMLKFPAHGFLDFYANHGLLRHKNRPQWSTVAGGSRQYVEKLIADGDFTVHCNQQIRRIVRQPNYSYIVDQRGVAQPFDQIVVATHADQALKLLDEPTADESEILGKFTYQPNLAVMHHDPRWMPKRRTLWSSWNYMKKGNGVEAELCVTYWMNRLQNLGTNTNLFLTLNPTDEIHHKAVEASFEYDHPVFSTAAVQAQKYLWSLQGQNRTWFCGSYFGYGFHEDGIQSGLAVAEKLGGTKRPWHVENESGRINLVESTQLEAAE